MKSLLYVILAFLFFATNNSLFAQTYPATLRVPVTFYDFHSDQTNPEFETMPTATGNTSWTGMVASTLDAEKKPTLGSHPFFNLSIAKWFRPWTSGDFAIPNYGTPTYPVANAAGLTPKFITVGYDTAFKNRVIQDTLIFNYVPASAGVYEFDDQTFFPLDGRGFGNEEKNHNFSFTMELHWKFTMQPGLNFQFTGDDDVWAFIDNQLVMDLGGRHGPVSGTVNVDALGLSPGEHSFDFFYCERHTSGADIKIMNNIIAAKPTKIDMVVEPNADTIPAGDSIRYTATVKDQSGGVITEYNSAIKWTLLPSGTASSLGRSNGTTNTFYGIDAYYTYYIRAALDTVTRYGEQVHLLWIDTVYVKPGPPANLFIEANYDSTVSLRDPARMGSTSMSSTTLYDSVYAVIRDKYGNWVKHADSAVWLTRDTSVVTVASGRTQLGEGVLTRQATVRDTAFIVAAQNRLTDSLRVIISDVNYSQVQIYVNPGGLGGDTAKNIDTLRMRTDQDTTLRARGLRADGSGRWDELPVDWYNSSNMTFNRSAPKNSNSWNFSPIDTATGIIYITYTSGTTVLRDTIKAFFYVGNPFSEALYPSPGQPNTTNNAPLPGSITIAAGTPFQIVAKLFDVENHWLSSYERTNAPFSWTIEEVQGSGNTGVLSTSTGFLTVFTAQKAFNSVKITASFQEGSISVPPKSILITVVAGPAHHLVIEGDTSRLTSPNSDNPLATVTIGARDTSGIAYAILRDSLGNWVGYSKSTEWQSFDTNQAKVISRNSAIGEGFITRVSKSGRTDITAKDLDHNGLRFIDTVLVILSDISYDSLRIVVRDSIQIQNLTMRTDEDTLIQVQGKRSDNGVWEAVPADWSIFPDLRTSIAPPKSLNSWNFAPVDTGAGIIVVNMAAAIPDTITLHFLHGLPYSLSIYPLPGAPGLDNMPLPSPGTAIIDTAGTPFQLVAKIFDKNGVWIGDYERSTAPISWKIVELTGNPPTGSLTNNLGYLTEFKSLKAYNTVYVVATFDTAGYQKFSDSVRIQVVPGKPAQLVIEENQNWQASPNTPRPVNRIQIDSMESYRYIYAIIRDSLGNFVNYSKITNWLSMDDSVVTVEDGLTSIGQGVVKRVTAGDSTYVIASSGEYPGLSDTIEVIVLSYFYIELRIVVRQSVPIDHLIMTTNDDTTLQVQGKRSDTQEWELISARWENLPRLVIDPAAPERSQAWRFSPVAPDSGWIRVTLGDDLRTKPDTITVKFLPGAPTRIEIILLTPPDKRIAGDTITAVVRIYNKDGLVPGTLCDTSIHQESLGRGMTTIDPIVIIDGSSSVLTQITFTGNKTYECFLAGLDTVKYILYNATSNKDQKLFVSIDTLSASTDPFNVLPAQLSSVAIQDYLGTNLDSVYLNWPNGSQVLFVVGYDRFGNKVVLSNGALWTATDNLHPIDKSVNVIRIYYDAIQVKRDESGFIYATVLDSSGQKIYDSVYVDITGPLTKLTTAVTGDADGDGYLDHIVLHFDKEADLSEIDSIAIKYTYENSLFKFEFDSIKGMSGNGLNDSVFTIYFSENTENHLPQTAWTPLITFFGDTKGITPVSDFKTSDGAGPVIWRVTKDMQSIYTFEDDEITVYFSEPIQSSDGSTFQTGTQPDILFYVLVKDTTGKSDTLKDTLKIALKDIGNFTGQTTDAKMTFVTFTMTNGYDITALDFFSIRVDSNSIIMDKARENSTSKSNNTPPKNNKPVQVEIISSVPYKLLVGPNPSIPTFRHENGGELHFQHNPLARDWVVADNAATVLSFMVDVINDPSLKISGYLKIYDIIGNPVQSASCDDILAGTGWRPGSGLHNFDIYWNQSNNRGMKVAPGNYLAVVYITIKKSNSTEKHRMPAMVGVSR